MSCPPNSLAGFVNLTTIPGTSNLNTIAANTYPFIMNFAPRTTPLTISGNRIEENPDNTLLYKGTQYYLLSATICKPSSGSYELYGTAKQSKGSLMFTYISSTLGAVTSNFNAASKISNIPLVMILILPIFQGDPSTNAPYLTQLKNPPTDTSKFMSMQGLFANLTSIGYSACIDIVLNPNATPTFGCPASIYNFTDGITISSDINVILATIPTYTLFQQNTQLIQSYNADGSPVMTNVSNSPVIMPPISVTDDTFINKMRYYLLPIATPQSSTLKPTNLTPDQYQCFPFDELQNLQTDNAGIKTVGNLGEVLIAQETQNQTVGAMLSWDQIGIFVIVILSVIGTFIVGGLIFWAISFFGDRKIPVAAIATAAVVPATAAIAGAATAAVAPATAAIAGAATAATPGPPGATSTA